LQAERLLVAVDRDDFESGFQTVVATGQQKPDPGSTAARSEIQDTHEQRKTTGEFQTKA
jgi:hypothetical protein